MCFRPAKVQAEKKCPVCSQSNPASATICSACGTELPETPPAAAGAAMPGAFGQAGIDGGGFTPNVAGAVRPGAPKAPKPPASPEQ